MTTTIEGVKCLVLLSGIRRLFSWTVNTAVVWVKINTTRIRWFITRNDKHTPMLVDWLTHRCTVHGCRSASRGRTRYTPDPLWTVDCQRSCRCPIISVNNYIIMLIYKLIYIRLSLLASHRVTGLMKICLFLFYLANPNWLQTADSAGNPSPKNTRSSSYKYVDLTNPACLANIACVF